MRIGDILITHKVLDDRQVRDCLDSKDTTKQTLPRQRLGDTAVVRGFIPERDREQVEQILSSKCHEDARNQNLRLALKSIADGRAILFAGAGFSIPSQLDLAKDYLTGEGIKTALLESSLLRQLTDRQLQQFKSLPLPDMAQWFQNRDPGLLYRTLEVISGSKIPNEPLWHHHCLAKINPFRFMVTTNWDCLIEKAFEVFGNERPLSLIQQDTDLTRLRLERQSLLKLHGSFEDGSFDSGPVISTQDFIRKRESNPLMYGLLKALFAAYDVVVVGFRPDDYNFTFLHATLAMELGQEHSRSIYVVDPDEGLMTDALVTRGLHIPLSSSQFFDYLSDYLSFAGGRVGMSSCPPNRYGDTADSSPVRYWSSEYTTLAKTLRSKYGLDHVEIVPTVTHNHGGALPDIETRQLLGKRAAHLMSEWTDDGDSVCLGGGDTTKWLVTGMDPAVQKKNLTLYAGSIRAFPGLASLSSTTTLNLLVEALRPRNARGVVFPIQRIIADYRMQTEVGGPPKDIPLEEVENAVADYFEEASNSRLCILGIGALNNTRGGFAELARSCGHDFNMREEDYVRFLRRVTNMLLDSGFVGDVLARPLRRCSEGKCFMERDEITSIVAKATPGDELYERFLNRLICYCWSLSASHLRKMRADDNKQSLVLASGYEKRDALHAALECQFFSSMLIDHELAQGLLKCE